MVRAVVIVLAVLFVTTECAGEVEQIPLRESFPRAMATCDGVYEGRISRTVPFDETVPDRTSVLIVAELLAGPLADSLIVSWSAKAWKPGPNLVAGYTCGWEFQLDGCTDREGVWLLEIVDGEWRLCHDPLWMDDLMGPAGEECLLALEELIESASDSASANGGEVIRTGEGLQAVRDYLARARTERSN